MKKPIIKLNGWQTIKDYAAAKGTNPNTVIVPGFIAEYMGL